MDRFLDDRDAARQDFVRLEYSQALKMGKLIVPVYKEDFEFPGAVLNYWGSYIPRYHVCLYFTAAPSRLPEDCRGVLSLNAIKWVADYRDASFKKLVAALQMR